MGYFDNNAIAQRLLGGARDIGRGVKAAAEVAGEGLDIMRNRRIANNEPAVLGEALRGRQITPEQQSHPVVQEAQVRDIGERFSGLMPGMSKAERLIPLDNNFIKNMTNSLNLRAGTKLEPLQIANGFYKLFGKEKVTETELKEFLTEKLKSFHPNEIDDIIREVTIPKDIKK